jgi:hypothetical protein
LFADGKEDVTECAFVSSASPAFIFASFSPSIPFFDLLAIGARSLLVINWSCPLDKKVVLAYKHIMSNKISVSKTVR